MNLSTSSFKKIFEERVFWLIPIMVLIILFIKAFAPKSDEKRVIENNSFWKHKTFDKKTYQIVIAGDSRVYRGVSPQAMIPVLPGMNILNFGYGSAGFDNIMLNEISKKIDLKAKQKVVVLGLTPLTLTQEGRNNYHLNYELKTKREELIELLYFKRAFQFFVPFTLDQMDQKLKGKEFQTTFHQEYTSTGWVATYDEKPWEESAIKSYSTRFINNQVTEENLLQVANKIKEWTQQGVMVFGFRPPTTHKMVALEDSLSGYNEQWVKTKIVESGGIWLDFNVDDYSTYDGSHLQKESAYRFSHDLATKIKPFVSAIP
jgi:hypothetical protein